MIEARLRADSGSRNCPAGQQTLVEIAAVKDDDVRVAGELAMLESVVEEMDAGC